ncbi:CYTH domain-containing protein [Salipaludibacillus sp. HK11]|uniref:CYTH domain-containing protein n=1 Tax=Salipaludibacillus sp. HK11 TaxID=3394320 RepID=UPI0039FCC2AA
MSQEIEIEFKNLINNQQYQTLLNVYSSLKGPTFEQVNHYFDTESFLIKASRSALRVRYKGNYYVLTLKQPHPEGLLETHQPINDVEFATLKEHGTIPNGEISTQLSELLGESVPKLAYLGHLTTTRTEIQLDEGLLVLDKSSYFDQVDYEIEFECEEASSGRRAFNKLIDSWGLTWKEPENKIQRFYHAKLKSDNR